MVDKVTKMAAELIFSVDAHISLTHSAASLTSVIRANILPKRLKISKHTNLHTVAKSLMLVTSINILPH